MRKLICSGLSLVLAMGLMAGCGTASKSSSKKSGKISVVTTIFPEYDWVREIVGENDNVEITMLLDKGVDLHSYQPSVKDIATVGACDVFVYVGGESDGWVDNALAEASNKDMKVINLVDVLGDEAKVEEIVEGMENNHDHHDHEDAEEASEHDHEDAEEEEEIDEHVWLSLKNAAVICSEISSVLGEVDKEHKSDYEKNYKAYQEKLTSLDQKYESAVSEASLDTVLFGDRFPFRYLMDDYKIHYFAAFTGCSAESEASFETITFLAGKVDELGLKSILKIESSTEEIAKTISENTESKDQEILTMDSMQATTSSDVKKGATYLSVMEKNLEVLKKALN